MPLQPAKGSAERASDEMSHHILWSSLSFPAKLHAILGQPDLADIVDWLPHGRSWRILKPRDFETKIIPRFFEHSKFSSFVRQANGWGFRRITQGPDRNSYYHEKFLRGLPHLCKSMKRPGVAEKRICDPDLEPDFYKISEMHPVPKSTDDESIFLQKTLRNGPKARMPIITEHFKSLAAHSGASSSVLQASSHSQTSFDIQEPASTPTEWVMEVSSAQEQVAFTNVAPCTTSVVPKPAVAGPAAPPISPPATTAADHKTMMLSPSTMNQMAIQFPMPCLDQENLAMSSFAAGYAAATTQYQQHFYSMMRQMSANKQLPEGFAFPNLAIPTARTA
jgi:HSF-type DNA-binding